MRGFIVGIVLLAFGGIAVAAEPPPLVPNPLPVPNETYFGLPARGPATVDPLLEPNTKLVEPPPVLQRREDVRIALDLGLPTGVRVQKRIFETDIWAEVGVGAYVIVPFVSGCLRYDGTLYRGRRNLFAFRPGISATCVIADPNLGIGLDAELVWQHTYNDRFTSELGVRLGCTEVFWKDRYEGGWGGGWRGTPNPIPVPIATLMFSVAF